MSVTSNYPVSMTNLNEKPVTAAIPATKNNCSGDCCNYGASYWAAMSIRTVGQLKTEKLIERFDAYCLTATRQVKVSLLGIGSGVAVFFAIPARGRAGGGETECLGEFNCGCKSRNRSGDDGCGSNEGLHDRHGKKGLVAHDPYCPTQPVYRGGEFWSDGYFASTVGKHGDEGMIAKYVKNQGNEYLQLHRDEQLALF